MRMNARLMFSASPKPTASAMRSTGSAVVSMRPRARSTRSRSTTRVVAMRLQAPAGRIEGEPFHHARGRGARLRPECAAELAQAHADLLRQTLDGEPFGDVIASTADCSGHPVI